MPSFKLDELQTKKKAFYFNTDQLFAKPNELLKDNNENYYKFKFQEYERNVFGHLKVCLDLKNL